MVSGMKIFEKKLEAYHLSHVHMRTRGHSRKNKYV